MHSIFSKLLSIALLVVSFSNKVFSGDSSAPSAITIVLPLNSTKH